MWCYSGAMKQYPLRVVLDTNVIFEGLTKSQSAPGLIIELWQAELLHVCISDALWYEYEDVLFRLLAFERWRRAKPILDSLVQRAQMVTVFYTWRPMSVDSGDDHVIDCAMNAKALLMLY